MKILTALNTILAAATLSVLPLQAAVPLVSTNANNHAGTNSNSRRFHSALDQRFVTAAAQSGLYEIQLGEALAESDNPDVADYGQQLIADHTAANDQLADLADANGFKLPTTLDRAHQKRLDNLSHTPDAQMDRALIREAITSHQETIPLFQLEARLGTNPDVKNFAKTTLPTLEEHLTEAKQLSKDLKSNNP
jgi:putative membrane protein